MSHFRLESAVVKTCLVSHKYLFAQKNFGNQAFKKGFFEYTKTKKGQDYLKTCAKDELEIILGNSWECANSTDGKKQFIEIYKPYIPYNDAWEKKISAEGDEGGKVLYFLEKFEKDENYNAFKAFFGIKSDRVFFKHIFEQVSEHYTGQFNKRSCLEKLFKKTKSPFVFEHIEGLEEADRNTFAETIYKLIKNDPFFFPDKKDDRLQLFLVLTKVFKNDEQKKWILDKLCKEECNYAAAPTIALILSELFNDAGNDEIQILIVTSAKEKIEEKRVLNFYYGDYWSKAKNDRVKDHITKTFGPWPKQVDAQKSS